jgi:SAM-dependent methyltransferase
MAELAATDSVCNYDDAEDLNPLANYWMEGDSLAPPCQAEMDVVHSILDLAAANDNSVLYDLGCGDGRICCEAAKRFSCRSVGCEIEPHLTERFRQHVSRIKDRRIADMISIVEGDLRDLSLEDATVISLYLLPESVEEIKPKLIEALERGAVLICNTWGPKGFKPVSRTECGFANNVILWKYDKTSLV